jgi:isopentenyldiphosphate isomerase
VYIYLQIRSEDKKDFPGLLDITAAGHLTADETAEDGVREIEEELGLSLAYDDLVKLGVFVYQCDRPGFTDREFAHVHLYDKPFSLHDFLIPNNEVCGIVRAKFQDFYDLWLDIVSEINIEGFHFDAKGSRLSIDRMAAKREFAPHDSSFYIAFLQQLEKYLKTKTKK